MGGDGDAVVDRDVLSINEKGITLFAESEHATNEDVVQAIQTLNRTVVIDRFANGPNYYYTTDEGKLRDFYANVEREHTRQMSDSSYKAILKTLLADSAVVVDIVHSIIKNENPGPLAKTNDDEILLLQAFLDIKEGEQRSEREWKGITFSLLENLVDTLYTPQPTIDQFGKVDAMFIFNKHVPHGKDALSLPNFIAACRDIAQAKQYTLSQLAQHIQPQAAGPSALMSAAATAAALPDSPRQLPAAGPSALMSEAATAAARPDSPRKQQRRQRLWMPSSTDAVHQGMATNAKKEYQYYVACGSNRQAHWQDVCLAASRGDPVPSTMLMDVIVECVNEKLELTDRTDKTVTHIKPQLDVEAAAGAGTVEAAVGASTNGCDWTDAGSFDFSPCIFNIFQDNLQYQADNKQNILNLQIDHCLDRFACETVTTHFYDDKFAEILGDDVKDGKDERREQGYRENATIIFKKMIAGVLYAQYQKSVSNQIEMGKGPIDQLMYFHYDPGRLQSSHDWQSGAS